MICPQVRGRGAAAALGAAAAKGRDIDLAENSVRVRDGHTGPRPEGADGCAGPCNVLAGYHHDHLLVPAERADEAVSVLRSLAG